MLLSIVVCVNTFDAVLAWELRLCVSELLPQSIPMSCFATPLIDIPCPFHVL